MGRKVELDLAVVDLQLSKRVADKVNGIGSLYGAEGGDGQVGGPAGGFEEADAKAGEAAVFVQRDETGRDDVPRTEVQQPTGIARGRLGNVRHDDLRREDAERVVQRM